MLKHNVHCHVCLGRFQIDDNEAHELIVSGDKPDCGCRQLEQSRLIEQYDSDREGERVSEVIPD